MMASFWRRLVRRTWSVTHAPDWPNYAGRDWTSTILDWPEGERHHAKQGRSIGRFLLRGPKGPLAVFLKRQHRSSFWRGWLATLLPSSQVGAGPRESANLETVRTLGIPAPKVWAAGDAVGPLGRWRSVLALEELTGMLALHEAIPLAASRLPKTLFRRWKAGLVRELARLTRLMHDAGCFHQDLYLCHFFISESDAASLPRSWQGRVTLIDFHRLKQPRIASAWYRVKDLAQLLYSSDVPGVGLRDRLLFWRAYRGRSDRGLLRRLIVWKSKRYERHNEKKWSIRVKKPAPCHAERREASSCRQLDPSLRSG